MELRLYCVSLAVVCFFKQKTAYEMRISDWSSDVCSSDLVFQFIVTSDTRDLHPGSVGGLGEGLDLHHLPPREADVRTAEKAVRAFSYDQIGRESCRERVCQYV